MPEIRDSIVTVVVIMVTRRRQAVASPPSPRGEAPLCQGCVRGGEGGGDAPHTGVRGTLHMVTQERRRRPDLGLDQGAGGGTEP